jgi:hypothetical protein
MSGRQFRETSQIVNALEAVEKGKKMTSRIVALFVGLFLFILFVGGIAYMAGWF